MIGMDIPNPNYVVLLKCNSCSVRIFSCAHTLAEVGLIKNASYLFHAEDEEEKLKRTQCPGVFKYEATFLKKGEE